MHLSSLRDLLVWAFLFLGLKSEATGCRRSATMSVIESGGATTCDSLAF